MMWLEWSETAFAAARERDVPVLLFVRAAWCRWCREMERTVFRDPRVDRLVTERFVAVRVDKDRRPDIDARYSKGGWPTIAWLDDAGELLGADNFLEADELVERLELVAETYAKSRQAIRARLARAEAESSPAGESRRARAAAERSRRRRRCRSRSSSRRLGCSRRRPTPSTAAGAASTSSSTPRRSTSS
jgi:uncharacterized protein YyaL (SSP411 family)